MLVRLDLLRVAAVLVCSVLTGAAVLVPEHPWLQLLASASCGGFAWLYGAPPAAVLSAMLSRMRPEKLVQVVSEAAHSLPPERAEQVMQSLRPLSAASVPPVPIVFEGEGEAFDSAPTPTHRHKRL